VQTIRLQPSSNPIHRFSVSDQVLAELRRQIVHRQIPEGAPVPEAQCALSLGVSRVPVREALMQLERDGLISTSPTGKSITRVFSPSDCHEISLIRKELEGLAARHAASTRTPQDLERLRHNIEAFTTASSPEELAQLDVEFHELLCSTARHPWLLNAWQTIRWPFHSILVRGFRAYVQETSLEESKISTADHSRIVEALADQNSTSAETLIRQHISRWEEWSSES